MPQAPRELQDKFPGLDAEALEVIKENFNELNGLIWPKVPGYAPTAREDDAINYLWLEWDYGYDEEGPDA